MDNCSTSDSEENEFRSSRVSVFSGSEGLCSSNSHLKISTKYYSQLCRDSNSKIDLFSAFVHE